MKKLLFFLLFAGTYYTAQSQVSKAKEVAETQSNAEKFSEKSGTLIQRQFIDVGKIGETSIQVAVFTDLISGTKTSAVRFEKEAYSSYSSDTKVALLDADELDGLIKSLKIIQEKVFPTTPADYTEVNFASRSGFSAGCFYSKNKWSSYMKLEKYDSKSYEWLNAEDIPKLLSLLEQAKSKI